jgi:DNA-directed RNA polymerase subunit K/omega
MLDTARLERLTDLCGGRFRLTALIQKRLQELILNSPRLGETDTQELFETVLNEIESGKITLVLPEPKAATAAEVLGDK